MSSSEPARPALRAWTGRAAAVAALAVGAGLLTLLPGGAPSASAAGLVPWSDCEQMLRHYRGELSRAASPYGGGVLVAEDAARAAVGSGTDMAAVAAPPVAATAESAARGAAGTGGAVGSGPTGTNLQEAGVDEPDTAKLSGDLLLSSAGGRLQVLRAGPQPELISSLSLGEGAYGAELLVDGDRVLAVTTGFGGGMPVPMPMPMPMPVEPGPGGDTADPAVPAPDLPAPDLPAPDGAVPDLPAPDVPAPPAPAPPADLPLGEPEPMPLDGRAPVGKQPDPADEVAADDVAVARPAPAAVSIAPPVYGPPTVRLVLVDIADPAAPAVLETMELDGRYVSARLVAGTVRLVTSSTPQVPVVGPEEPYGPAQEEAALEKNRAAAQSAGLSDVLPQVVRRGPDGAELASGSAVDCGAVQHAESGAVGASTLLVTTLQPKARGLTAVDSTAVTTDGDLVYASADRLYVATSRWGTVAPATRESGAPEDGEVTTQVHAFDTSSTSRTGYLGSGEVRGYVYGRWALSEHEGNLRVATTLQPPWDGGQTSSSSVVVLGEDGDRLVERGRLDGLGPDERIYAVRYFGDIATVVTFRQTDPLYVLDLGDPQRPRLLGELKIPGFSTYLHPVGDDRLLGVGQDADETGQVTGFQLSLFDLTDLSKPVQVDRLSLGEGHSPAGEDSRAFGYDVERRLAVLPFTTYDTRTGMPRSAALGVRVTEDFRLEEVGRLDAGDGTVVERVLLGGGTAYAVTPQGVVAADAATLSRTGSAAFAGVEVAPVGVPRPLPEPVPGDVPPDGGVSILPVDPDCTTSSDGATVCSGGGGSGAGSGSAGSSGPGAAGGTEPGSPGTG